MNRERFVRWKSENIFELLIPRNVTHNETFHNFTKLIFFFIFQTKYSETGLAYLIGTHWNITARVRALGWASSGWEYLQLVTLDIFVLHIKR